LHAAARVAGFVAGDPTWARGWDYLVAVAFGLGALVNAAWRVDSAATRVCMACKRCECESTAGWNKYSAIQYTRNGRDRLEQVALTDES
jgi:hypothetical protein